jgi:hypothetical protein
VQDIGLWRHEAARSGWPALLTPAVVGVAVAALAAVMLGASAPHDTVVRLLVAGSEAVLPLAAGIGAASLAGRDAAVELQLSLPTPYRSTLLRRLAVTVTWPALLALAGSAVPLATGWWPPAHAGAESLLVWAAPLCWLAALGAFLSVWLRSTAAASGVVAGLWLVELIFGPLFGKTPVLAQLYLFPTSRLPDMPGWTTNRAVLLGTAAVLLAGLAWLLSRPHRLLFEEDE